MLTIPTFRWLFPILTLLWNAKADSQDARIVCYYTNWSVYRPGTAKFNPQNINPYLCTHLVYAFGGFTKENNFKPFDKYQDIEKGGYAKFTGLKTYNKQLKTLLAVGGWNEGSSRFSPMVASPERRKEFIRNAIKFLRQNHFDGLDLDWEYPSFRDGGKPRDRENYALLVQGLREEFDRESEKTGRTRLLLTMAVPAGIEYIKKGYDLDKLNRYLDWMNILSYDYHSAFEPAVNHHAPLYPLEEESEYNYDVDLNIHHTIKFYLENGVDREKLVVGIPTYGRSYTLYNPEANEIGAPADGPGEMGDATRENGYLAYYEICEKVKSDNWTVVQPNPDAMGPYAFKDNQWVGYDDDSIVRKKAEYVAEHGLGGIMFWSVDNDDFRGNCFGKPYPLIEAGKEALIAATSNTISSRKPSKGKTTTRHRKPTKVSSFKEENSIVQNSGGRQVVDSSSQRRRVNSIRQKDRENEKNSKNVIHKRRSDIFEDSSSPRKKSGRRRSTTTTTTSRTITSTTPKYYTPEPPTTPDTGTDFKCEDEGFFPHPRDCKKYFWCLSSGPSELGIVAHQFTCPSGLYFNKAADSCDYTQNVLCNIKKKAKASSTTTEPSTTKASTTKFTTTRRTSTTSTTTTTTPDYEEYEYEDDLEDAKENGGKHTEEDPKVIKELLELIKKAGGIEELERQLKFEDDGTAVVKTDDSTTPSTISKSLYERVLNRNIVANSDKTKSNTIAYKTLNRNSRGPQSEGLQEEKDKEVYSKSTPKYTTIQRRRPSTEKPVEEDDEEYEDEELEDEEPLERVPAPEVTEAAVSKSTFRRVNHPEYVTIRRTRPSTSSTTPETLEDDDEDEEEISHQRSPEIQSSTSSSLEYATLKRNKPSTVESSTIQYVSIRGRTTTVPSSTESKNINVEDTASSDTLEVSTESGYSKVSQNGNAIEDINSIGYNNDSDDKNKHISTTDKQPTTTEVKNIPHLSEPTPFLSSRRTRPTTSATTPSTTTPKVSPNISSNRLRKRPTKIPSRRPNVEATNEKSAVPLNSLENSNDKNQEDKTELENRKIPQRRRGGGRFRLQASESVATQSKDVPLNQVDKRIFRPDIAAELTDLSSLTAVDIEIAKDTRQNHRRRRPSTSTTLSPKTTKKEVITSKKLSFKEIQNRSDLNEEIESNKNIARTENIALPLKRRRITNRNIEDSSASTSNTSEHHRPLENTNNTQVDTPVRRTIRRRVQSKRPTNLSEEKDDSKETEKVRKIENLNNSTVENTTNKPRRKVIRRLLHRTTQSTTVASTTENKKQDEAIIEEENEVSDKEAQQKIENESISFNNNETKTTSNDSLTVSKDNHVDNKTFVTSGIEAETEEIANISDDDEEENIKLSETIISESKNTDFNRNAFFDIDVKPIDNYGKNFPDKILTDSDQSKEDKRFDEDKTEANKFNRRRKIIRKFPTVELSTTAASVSVDDFGEKTQPNKITRRLRPQNRVVFKPEISSTTEESEITPKKYIKRPSLFLRNKQYNTEKKSTLSLEYLNKPSPSTEEPPKSELFKKYSRRPYNTIQRNQRTSSTTSTTINVLSSTLGTSTTTDYQKEITSTENEFDSNLESSSTASPYDFSTTEDYEVNKTDFETESTSTVSNEAYTSSTFSNPEDKSTETLETTTSTPEYSDISSSTETEFDTFSTTFTTDFGSTTNLNLETSTDISTSYGYETTTEDNASTNIFTTVSSTVESKTLSTTRTTTVPTSKVPKNRLFSPNSSRPKLRLNQKSNPLLLKISGQDKDKGSDKRPLFKIYNSRYGGNKKSTTTTLSTENDDEELRNHGREENDIEEEKVDKIENDSNVSREEVDDDVTTDLKLGSTRKPSRTGFRPSFTRKPITILKARPTTTTFTEQPSTTSNILKALDARNKILSSNSRRFKKPLIKQEPSSTSANVNVIESSTSITNDYLTSTSTQNDNEIESTTVFYSHVFAQNESSTTPFKVKIINETADVRPAEKLIEVNRIVKVSLKRDENDSSEGKEVTLIPSVDKVGLISRVKVVNVVDGTKNLTLNYLNFDPNLLTQVATDQNQANQIHIDSKSMVHTFTAKPPRNYESATIPLESLFNYRPLRENDKFLDEIESLETENSHRVSVTIIQPKPPVNREEKKIEPISFSHPLNFVHENGALRAKVVEVTPEFNSELIRIAPISVSLGEKLPSSQKLKENKETVT